MENIEKHDLILSAARHLIEESGFSTLTMDKVAARAGIAKGTIYLYFKDKNELMESVLQKGFENMFGRIKKKVDEQASSEKKLEILIFENLTYINENRFFFKTVFLDETNIVFLKKKSIESFNTRRKRYADFVADIIENGVKDGKFRNDLNPSKTGYLLISLIKTNAVFNFLNKNQELTSDMIVLDASEIFNLFMKGISNR